MSAITIQDMVGLTFGEWGVLSFSHSAKGNLWWICKCSCGNTKVLRGSTLRLGRTKSCGCKTKDFISKANTRHGLANLPIYQSHANMLDRCYNSKNKDLSTYGGKGVIVCERWHDVVKFREDMGDPPTSKHLVGRHNTEGNYEPGNVFWGTKSEIAINRKAAVNLTYKGKTQCLISWARELNLDPRVLYARVSYGWDDTKVLGTPITKSKKWEFVDYIDPITKEISKLPIAKVAELTNQSSNSIRNKLNKGLPLGVVLSNTKRKPSNTKLFDFHGEQKTVCEIAEALNVTEGLIYRKLREGVDLSTLKPNTEEYIPFIDLTYNGKTQNITQWSKELGISDITIRRRISKGYPIEKVLDTTDNRKVEQEYPFRGDKFTTREIAEILGVSRQSIARKIRLGQLLE